MEAMVNSETQIPDSTFWSHRKVLLTGHTGFKGGWLAIWLERLGADITGIALPPDTEPSLFGIARVADGLKSHFCDICDRQKTAERIRSAKPEIVFHLAAQSLVRPGYRHPVETFATNVMGTVHMLDALRGLDTVRVAVLVTSDKVYRNRGWPYPYRENDALGGHDPYSASKAASEIVSASYRGAFLAAQGVVVATARAGNVIGGGDWAEDRLIPDAVRAWQADMPLHVRRPEAIRPWQHVLEPLAGYLALAERMWADPSMAGAWNFGPKTDQEVTVRQLIQGAREAYGKGEIDWGADSGGPHEAERLTLETSKARGFLAVRPRWSLDEAVVKTMNWYRKAAEGVDPRDLCQTQINEYGTAG